MRAVPRASCIDGVLRIAVVKKSPEILGAVESATEKAPSAETDDENENSDSVTTLSVPGFGARDISVTLHKPEDFLVVEGASKTFGNFKKRLRYRRSFNSNTSPPPSNTVCCTSRWKIRPRSNPWMSSFRTWR